MKMRALVVTGFLLSASLARAEGQAFLFYGPTFAGDLLLENKGTFGGTVGAFSGPFGAEFMIDYTPLGNFTVGSLGLGASMTNVAANVVVQIPFGAFAPFGTVGYGAFFADADTGQLPVDFLGTFGALNFGFGAKVFVSEHIGVRLEYRRFAIQTGNDNPKLVIPVTGIRISADPDLNRFTVGASFRF